MIAAYDSLDSPNDVAAEPASRLGSWHLGTIFFLVVLLLLRIVYLFAVPLDLIHDEAYYWDWSRHLDWGYYSKPPLIAWLIALTSQFGDGSAEAVRLPAVLLGTCGLYSVYLLGSRMYGPKVGFFSTLACAATPGNAALSLLMTIDAPFLFFFGLSLYAVWRSFEQETISVRWLAVAIASTGMGLLAKQTMVAVLLGAGTFLLLSAPDRRRLVRPGFVALVAGSLMFLLPVIWWNASHGWITFQHTGHHFSVGGTGLLKRFTRGCEFLLGQTGVVTPVTFAYTSLVLVAAGVGFLRMGRREKFLICFSGLPLACVLGLSFLIRVQPNWPAAFYPAGIILMVAWATGRIELRIRWPWQCDDQRTHADTSPNAEPALPSRPASVWRPNNMLARTIGVGTLCVIFTYSLPFWSTTLGLDRLGLDPTSRLRGWQQLGNKVDDLVSKLPDPDRTLMVVTSGRAATSELAFYLPRQPDVYIWNPSPRVVSQYDLWEGPQDCTGWDAAILTRADAKVPRALAAAFESVQLAADIEIPVGAIRSNRYRLWHGSGLRDWPEKASAAHSKPRTAHRTLPGDPTRSAIR